MKIFSFKAFLFVLNVSIFQNLYAQTLPEGVKKITSVEGITEYDLSNGLKVLLFPDPSKPTITVNITYLVGSRSEGYGETGMAHLLEHMVFKGTNTRPDVSKELNDHGGRFNGTTWTDRTNYFETFTSTDENLTWALEMEADRMVNSRIAKKDLESEMTVVRNEFEMGENNPSNVLNERLMSTAYLWHNYGKSTIGNRADIENVPIENLQAFYRKYYQPDNSVLLVAGKIDEAKTLALIAKNFSKIPRPTRELPTSYTTEPTQDGERSVVLKRVGDIQLVFCAYHIPAGSHPDFAAVKIMSDILDNDPSGRLYKALVETKKAASDQGYVFQFKEPGLAFFGAEVRKEQSLDVAKTALINTLDSMSLAMPSKEEVERYKTKELKELEEFYRNSERVGVAMSNYISMGDWRLYYLYRDAIKKVTPEDVLRISKAYLKPSNRTVGIFIPEAKPDRSEIPGIPEISALVKDYKGEAPIAEGEAFDPSPKNIESRTHKGKEGLGIEYAFLPKTTRGKTVTATMTLRFADEKSLFNKKTISDLTVAMLQKGTKTKTEQQLKDALNNLKATVRIYGDGGTVTASVESIKENLPATLQIVNEMLTQSVFPEKEFEQLRQEQLSQLEQQKSEPQAIAGNELNRILNPYPKGDIRANLSTDENIDAVKTIKLEDVKNFYKSFYGASNATVAVVGDFDEAAVKQTITNGLNNWKSPIPFKRVEGKFTDVPKSNKTIKTPDKANAMFMAGMNLKMNDIDPDFAALYMGNEILGGGALSSRLADRIRKKDGLSYGVGSFFNAPALDNDASVFFYAIYAPENLAKLEAAFKEEVTKITTDGVTEKELTEAKKAYLQSRMINRSQDRTLSGKLNNNLFYKRDMSWDINFEDKINKLTVADVNAALKKYVDYNKISIVKAGDFDKKAKP